MKHNLRPRRSHDKVGSKPKCRVTAFCGAGMAGLYQVHDVLQLDRRRLADYLDQASQRWLSALRNGLRRVRL